MNVRMLAYSFPDLAIICRATACFVALACCTVLGGCDCGSSSLGDAGDAADAPDAPDAATSLPLVEPRGPSCDEWPEDEKVACVEAGWFLFYRYQTLTSFDGGDAFLPIPTGPAYLDAYWLDRYEASQGEYALFAEESGPDLPPALCGYEDKYTFTGGEDPGPSEYISEVSETRADHPVVCVTRAEATDFCAARGGRLPTVAEWMKAGQPAFPDSLRFPWGDAPPTEGRGLANDYVTLFERFVWTSQVRGASLWTMPAGSRPDGASVHGVFDLVGNVSELLADCYEQLEPTYGVGPIGRDQARPVLSPLVRPGAEVRPACTDAVIVGGTNWRSVRGHEALFSQNVWAMRDGVHASDPRAPDDGRSGFDGVGGLERDWPLTRDLFGVPQPISGETPAAGPGNERRSWRVGFRCAYDTPPTGR